MKPLRLGADWKGAGERQSRSHPGCASGIDFSNEGHHVYPSHQFGQSVPVFVIAFGLTLTASLLAPLLGNALMIVHTLTPVLAALLMLLVVTRDGYTRGGWRSLGLHRAGLRFWGLALLGPLVLMSAVYGLAWSIGVGHAFMPAGFTLATVPLEFLVQLGIGSAFALCEALGSAATCCRG
jgi:hypothetical protein